MPTGTRRGRSDLPSAPIEGRGHSTLALFRPNTKLCEKVSRPLQIDSGNVGKPPQHAIHVSLDIWWCQVSFLSLSRRTRGTRAEGPWARRYQCGKLTLPVFPPVFHADIGIWGRRSGRTILLGHDRKCRRRANPDGREASVRLGTQSKPPFWDRVRARCARGERGSRCRDQTPNTQLPCVPMGCCRCRCRCRVPSFEDLGQSKRPVQEASSNIWPCLLCRNTGGRSIGYNLWG